MLYYVPVNSTTPALLGKPQGIWLFLKNFGQFPGMLVSLDGQTPRRLALQKASNPLPISHY